MTTFNNAPTKSAGRAKVAVLGVPYDYGSTTRSSGQAWAPRAIRLCYEGPAVNGLVDLGDLEVEERNIDDLVSALAEEVDAILADEADRIIVLGGDDSISYGVLMGMDHPHLIHLDAHDDQGKSGVLDHASWVYRAVEDGLVGSVQQVGLRAPESNFSYLKSTPDRVKGPVCLVIDVDVFDPSNAPGVTVPEPFGVSPLTIKGVIQEVTEHNDVRALVITEVSPPHDVNEMTSRLAFRIALDFALSSA